MDGHGSSRPGPPPDVAADPDVEWAQYTAWLDREAAAGREPEPWPDEEAEPWDPEPAGPDLDGRVPAGPGRPLFAEDGTGDVMRPGPFLAALTEQAVSDVAGLCDNELVGVLRASRRLVAREQYKQALAAAEFGRRLRARWREGCRPGARRAVFPARN